MVMKKRAAMELTTSSLVVIVLAMSMLILGLILMKTIFDSAKYNVDEINNKVKDQIGQLFVEDQEVVVYLSGKTAKIKQGKEFGIAFGVKNLKQSSQQQPIFSYEIVTASNDGELMEHCGVTKEEAESWIWPGQTNPSFELAPGEIYCGLAKFNIPKGSAICTIRYNLIVKADNQAYSTELFDVEIK